MLATGRDIPKYNYMYDIDVNKLAMAISFIQNSLYVKLDVLCNISTTGYVFHSMLVYEYGRKSIESMNHAYNKVFEKRIE